MMVIKGAPGIILPKISVGIQHPHHPYGVFRGNLFPAHPHDLDDKPVIEFYFCYLIKMHRKINVFMNFFIIQADIFLNLFPNGFPKRHIWAV